MKQPKYRFYATILNSFSDYLNSSEIYNQYFGNSENPRKSEEEFEKEQFHGLIDRINRVPFESEAADKGTVFNEVVDCLIENRQPRDDMKFETDKSRGVIVANFKDYTFEFPLKLCLAFRDYFKDALTQVYVSATLETKYGTVELYGYIDELLPVKVCDIKTTSRYSAFKYRKGWQHLVYPYCLIVGGDLINEFEYTVTDFRNVWKETYLFEPDRDIQLLINHVEQFIEFLEANKGLITDKKIFNE